MSRQYETRPDTKLPEWAVIEVIERWWPSSLYDDDAAKQRLRSAITARYDLERKKEREHASHGI